LCRPFLLYFKGLWQRNRHYFQKLNFFIRVIIFLLKKLIAQFLNFVWGKYHIKNKGFSKYWGEIKIHQDKINGRSEN
jgi:hypothetical protein